MNATPARDRPQRLPLSVEAARWARCANCGERIGHTAWGQYTLKGLYCSPTCLTIAASTQRLLASAALGAWR